MSAATDAIAEQAPGDVFAESVGTAMDEAKLSPFHYRIFGLIAAGYFFDVCDYAIFGSLAPGMIKSGFITAGQVATVASATYLGLSLGTIAQGQFTDRFGRKTIYQFNLLLYGVATIAAAMAPNYIWLLCLRFFAGIGMGAEQPLCYAYAAEYAPRRVRGRCIASMQLIGGAISQPLIVLFALFCGPILGWRGCWIIIGIGALIVLALRFSLPESPRWLAANGKARQALDVLKRLKIALPPLRQDALEASRPVERRDPFWLVIRSYWPRLIAGGICFVAFLGTASSLTTWLPKFMGDRGMSITQSLTYTFCMILAYPSASLFMMFSVERFGRKVTSMTAFVLAGVFAVLFMNSINDLMLIAVGFCMIFCIQLAGNTMQVFASEVFPTAARASGFGIIQACGRLTASFAIPLVLWLQLTYGVLTVFVVLAMALGAGAVAVFFLGPETRNMSLDRVAPTPIRS